MSTKLTEGWIQLERYIKGQRPENLQEAIEMERTGEAKIIDGVIYLRGKEEEPPPIDYPPGTNAGLP